MMIRRALYWLCLLALYPAASYGQDPAAGEDLFNRKCAMCHRLSDATKVGPGLQGVTERRTGDWLHEWLADPKAMVDKGDPAAVELLKKFKKVMSKVAAMETEKNRADVIAFLKENDKKKE